VDFNQSYFIVIKQKQKDEREIYNYYGFKADLEWAEKIVTVIIITIAAMSNRLTILLMLKVIVLLLPVSITVVSLEV
jgi:hypothetical protein